MQKNARQSFFTARRYANVPLAASGRVATVHGPVPLCTLGLGLLNPPSFRGR